MILRKNDLVKHPTKAEWGIGKVLENSYNNMVDIFFLEVGEKKLSIPHVKLVKLKPGEQSHPVLDNLVSRKSKKGDKYLSPSQSKRLFLQRFPGGFHNREYIKKERDYKISAHLKAIELLEKDELKALIDNSDFDGICSRALKVVNATNIIFKNEKMALKDGLKSDKGKELFSKYLYELLYGSEELEKRFNQFVGVLEEIDASKWTTATYFPFIVYPDKYIFVKPSFTQRCAKNNYYEINYKPKLNWLTYTSILQFSEYLKEELKDLNPKDMIDIQSFIWLIARN